MGGVGVSAVGHVADFWRLKSRFLIAAESATVSIWYLTGFLWRGLPQSAESLFRRGYAALLWPEFCGGRKGGVHTVTTVNVVAFDFRFARYSNRVIGGFLS